MTEKIRVPRPDIKKKPTPQILKKIANSANDKKHPFHKVKEKKKEDIEKIFIKKKSK
tara:strand:+ start:2967 stop:3137 length:171 start_codon:yes stop_codon:yes gene_type:complete